MSRYDLDSVQLVVVGLAALAGIAQFSLAPILFVLLIAFFVLERFLWKRRLPATPANLALLFLAIWILINPFFSVRPAVSFPIAMQILVGICLLFSVRAWATTAGRLHKLLLLLCVAGLVLVVIAPFTVDWITDKYGYFSSALYAKFSPLSRKVIHPNIIAGAAAVLLVTLVVYQRFAWKRLLRAERILFSGTSISLAALLAVSQSRGAMTAAAIGLISMFLFKLPMRRVGPILIFVFVATPALLEFSGFGLGVLADSNASIRGVTGRQEIWSHAGEVITHYPLTGIGFGNFTAVTDLFYPFLLAGTGQSHAHNLYLQVAVDGGLTLLIAWLACMLLVVLCCIQAVHPYSKNGLLTQGERSAYTAFGMALLCGQLTLLIHGLTDAPLWATRPAALVWILWGMALALKPSLRPESG